MDKGAKVVLAAVLVLAMVLGSAGLLFAREGREVIEVIYRNIGIKVHGVDIPIAPENEPFIYQGRTYVPLRLISEALGYNVEWDGATFTVLIGDVPGDVFLSELRPYYARATLKYDRDANMVMGGKKYYNGIMFLSEGTASFNLDAQYSRLAGLVGLDDSKHGDVEVFFYGDDRLLKIVSLKPGDLPKPVDISMRGVLVLRVDCKPNYHTRVNLADMVLEK